MSDKLKEYVRESIDNLLKSLPPEELRKRLSPEERLKGLSAEEMARALSLEARKALARELMDNGSSPESGLPTT